MYFQQIIAAALTSVNECPSSSCDPTDMLIPTPSEITITTAGFSTQDGPVDVEIDETWSDLGDEGYSLSCHQEGFRISARTQKGLFYGQQTLNQIKRIGLIPNCTITDVPVMGMRAVMFDMARCKEKHEYYYHIIDQLAQWKINTVFLHINDNSGCAMEFKCYPSLATLHAFTQDEMKDMIKYAQDRHIELIPEIETWGHAKYITTRPEFADLAEDKNDARVLCTSNPRTWEMLSNIIDEVSELFPSKYIHIGCDEADFGKCPECVARIERDGSDALVGEHVSKVCELAKERGKTPIVWADILVQHRGSFDIIPKYAIITHWDYIGEPSPEPVEFIRSKGYEVLGCSAIVQGSRMILPMMDTLDNVMNFTKIILDNDCIGMETTVWLPQRYIADTINFALAYASELSWSGLKRPRINFANAFARNYFGIDKTAEIAQTLIDMHDLSEKSFPKLHNLWNYTGQLIQKGELDTSDIKDRLELAKAIAGSLRTHRSDITDHLAEYDSLILAADVSIHIQERAIAVHRFIKAMSDSKTLVSEGKTAEAQKHIQTSIDLLKMLAKSENAMQRRLEEVWDRWRYIDDPLRIGTGENLMEGFMRARQFMRVVPLRLSKVSEQIGQGISVDWDDLFRTPEDGEDKGFVDAGDVMPV